MSERDDGDGTSDADEWRWIAAQAREHLARLAEHGVSRLPLAQVELAPVEEVPAAAASSAARGPDARDGSELRVIRADLGDCKRCKLHPTRKNIVFGVGNPAADLVFVGEAPGANEDAQGEPFVGDAGQLLTRMIAAMGWAREDVYIANILKCLRYNTSVQLENGSWERIGRLVKQRYGGRVMSVDHDGALVPKRVTGWYESPLGDRRVLKLSYASSALRGGNRALTWLTHDHQVMTRRGWIEAQHLVSDDEIAIGQGLSGLAQEIVTGALLGDGTINRQSSYLAMIHSRDQAEWVELKARALAELSPIVYPGTSTAAGRTYLTTISRTRATRALRVVRSRFYPEGKKVVPADLRLTPLALAVWFLDDGYTRVRSERNALSEIAAHGFTPADAARLVERLREDLGIEAYQRDSSAGRLLFGAAASERLSRVIAPYCPPSMRYKLHPSARELAFDPALWQPGPVETLYDRAVVEPVDFDGTDRTLYCIDVEDTHNFVTSGGVVHNCRPPGNRNPEPDEIAECEPFLIRQLAALKPRMIVALGKFAAQCLLRKPDTPISALRGRFHEYHGIRVMPTYHPAYLLRTPSAKRQVWDDLQLVMAELERLGVKAPHPPRA